MSKFIVSQRLVSILLAAFAVSACQEYDIKVMPNPPAQTTSADPPGGGTTVVPPVVDVPVDPPAQDPTVGSKLAVTFETATVPDSGYKYDFGKVRLGSAQTPKILDISNPGTGTLNVSVALPVSQVLVEGATTKSLAPNEHMQIKVTLKTAALTPDTTGTIKIASSDPDRPSVQMQMTSKIVRSQIQVFVGSSTTPQDLTQAITIDFGTIAKGSSTSGSAVVKNVGEATLNASVLNNLTHFTLNTPSLILDQNASATLTITPKTTDVGSFSETFLVNSDDPEHGSITITVKAQVAIAALLVYEGARQLINNDAASKIDFGTTYESKAGVVKTVTLKSGGVIPLSVSNITLPAGFKFQAAPSFPMVVGDLNAAVKTFNVVQDTANLGPFDDWMVITSNDSASSTFKVRLTSVIAVEPHYGEIQVFHTTTAAANELQNNQAAVVPFTASLLNAAEPAETFIIKNIGDGALNLSDIKVPTGFYLPSKPAAQSIAKNGTVSFVVKRKTDTGGIVTGALEIDTDDADENAFKVTISGVVNELPFVCNAFDTASANASNQILGQIYSGNKSMENDINLFFARDNKGVETYKLPALLCFDNFNVPERDWTAGFGSGSAKLKDPTTGDTLNEWFAIKTASNLKLGTAAAGYYQLATVSDDGSMVYINGAVSVDNNVHHSQRMRCSNQAYDLRNPATRMKIRIDYFQGPQTEIAMVLLWRKVDPTKTNYLYDEKCDQDSFRKDTAAYNAILSRGWSPVPGSSFELSADLLGGLQ